MHWTHFTSHRVEGVFYRIWQKLEWYKLEPVAHTIDDHIANSKVELHTLALVYYTSSFIQHISMILIMWIWLVLNNVSRLSEMHWGQRWGSWRTWSYSDVRSTQRRRQEKRMWRLNEREASIIGQQHCRPQEMCSRPGRLLEHKVSGNWCVSISPPPHSSLIPLPSPNPIQSIISMQYTEHSRWVALPIHQVTVTLISCYRCYTYTYN